MRGKDLRNETGVEAPSTLRFQPSDFALPTVILALAGGLYLETTRFDPVPELLSQGVPARALPARSDSGARGAPNI